MKVFYILSMLLICDYSAYSQWAVPANMRAENTLDRLSDKNGLSNSDILYGIPLPPGNVVGDVYFDKKWNAGSIMLYETETLIEGYPMKYDVKSEVLEIKSKAGVKILDTRKIKSLVWKDSLTNIPHYFINGAEFKLEGVPVKGLLEVLVDGKTPLIKRDQIFVKEPTYNVAMGSGSRDTKIYHKVSYYYISNSELIKVKGKKEIIKISSNPVATEEYFKSNKINLGKEAGLIKAFEYLNTL